MPVVAADRLTTIGSTLLQAAGASQREATTVAQGCASAPTWPATTATASSPSRPTSTASARATSFPARRSRSNRRAPTTTVIDGNWGFGFVVAETRDEAHHREGQEIQRRGNHHPAPEPRRPGRRLPADGGQGGHDRDHDGGLRPLSPRPSRRSAGARRGSAPTRSASPCRPISTAPFVLDMATSAVAAGKIKLAQAKGAKIPEGWMRRQGRQADDRPVRVRQGRRAAAARRIGGLQGLRPLGDGRGALGACCPASASASIRPAVTTTAASSPCSRSRPSARWRPSRRR